MIPCGIVFVGITIICLSSTRSTAWFAAMNEVFRGLGVDYLIEGGQTMNPSTEDMLNAIAVSYTQLDVYKRQY